MSNIPIEDSVIYHVYNRGVDKRDVFLELGDYSRFIHYLYHLNDAVAKPTLSYHLEDNPVSEPSPLSKRARERSLLVDLFAFVLMPNHFHLMLRQRVEGGAALFMQKLGTGYTMYFNEKYTRSGSLFQGTFKRKAVTSNAQLRYLPHYIHLNPLALSPPTSKTRQWSLAGLEKYKWSSLSDYIGKKNIPSVTTRAEILDLYGGPTGYRRDLRHVFDSKKEQYNMYASLIDIGIEEK